MRRPLPPDATIESLEGACVDNEAKCPHQVFQDFIRFRIQIVGHHQKFIHRTHKFFWNVIDDKIPRFLIALDQRFFDVFD